MNRFAPIPEWVMRRADVSAAAKLVYGAIFKRAKLARLDEIEAAVDELVDDTGIPERTLRRHLHALERADLVAVTRRRSKCLPSLYRPSVFEASKSIPEPPKTSGQPPAKVAGGRPPVSAENLRPTSGQSGLGSAPKPPAKVAGPLRPKWPVSDQISGGDQDPDQIPPTPLAPPAAPTPPLRLELVPPSPPSGPSPPAPRQVKPRKPKAERAEAGYAAAYAQGQIDGGATSFAPPTRDLIALRDAAIYHAHRDGKKIVAPDLVPWFRETSAAYRRAWANAAQYQGGFGPFRFLAWLQGGRPTAGGSASSRLQQLPAPEGRGWTTPQERGEAS